MRQAAKNKGFRPSFQPIGLPARREDAVFNVGKNFAGLWLADFRFSHADEQACYGRVQGFLRLRYCPSTSNGFAQGPGQLYGMPNEAPCSNQQGILSGIAPKPYPPSLSRAAARSPRHSSLQQAAEYPGEGEWSTLLWPIW